MDLSIFHYSNYFIVDVNRLISTAQSYKLKSGELSLSILTFVYFSKFQYHNFEYIMNEF